MQSFRDLPIEGCPHRMDSVCTRCEQYHTLLAEAAAIIAGESPEASDRDRRRWLGRARRMLLSNASTRRDSS